MGPPILAFVVILIVVAAIVALAKRARRYAKKVEDAWQDAAELVEGTFSPQTGPWYRRKPRRIDADVNGTPVVVDHYAVSNGKTTVVYTRCEAQAWGSAELELQVFPKHAFSGLSRALGFQDVEIGDADFDDAFIVKANDEDMARAWLSKEVRDAIRSAVGFNFKLNTGKLTVSMPKLLDAPDDLATLAQATATVASRGEQIRERWQRFATERNGELESHDIGRLRIAAEQESVPLRIDTDASDDHRYTRVTSRVVGGRSERYELSAEAEAVESTEPDKTARRLTDRVRARVERLAPSWVKSDGEEVTIYLRGVETDAARLREAAELAKDLATAQSDAYR